MGECKVLAYSSIILDTSSHTSCALLAWSHPFIPCKYHSKKTLSWMRAILPASSRPMPISCRWPFLAKFVTSYFVSTLSLPEHASKHYICIHGNTGRRASCEMYFLSCSALQQQIHVCYDIAFQQVIIISFNLILSGGTYLIWKISSYP